MESRKNKSKASVGYNILAELVKKAVDRWTKESPETYKTITYVSAGISIATSIVLSVPASWPIWVVPLAFGLSAIASKFTIK